MSDLFPMPDCYKAEMSNDGKDIGAIVNFRGTSYKVKLGVKSGALEEIPLPESKTTKPFSRLQIGVKYDSAYNELILTYKGNEKKFLVTQ